MAIQLYNVKIESVLTEGSTFKGSHQVGKEYEGQRKLGLSGLIYIYSNAAGFLSWNCWLSYGLSIL